MKLNIGYITIGTSHDTSGFACECIRLWWVNYGKKEYPEATSILILCDGGGSNSSHFYIFKEKLQELVNQIGVEIRIAHYPPYTSKYNPVEHKLFPHVTRACKGLIFENIDIVKQAISKTKTKTGLRVCVQILDKIYNIGNRASKEFKMGMKIIFDPFLPRWNYRAIPLL